MGQSQREAPSKGDCGDEQDGNPSSTMKPTFPGG